MSLFKVSGPLLLILAVTQLNSVSAQVTVIRASRLLDVASGEMRIPGVLVVEGDHIREVNPSSLPASAPTIDLGDATLLPGLIDAHTHLMDEPGADWIQERVYETPATWTLRAARNANLELRNGFTTVRDLGSAGFVDVALSRAIEAGWINGPHVLAAGHYIKPTGGHCDLTGLAPGVLEQGVEQGVADGPEEVVKAVRYQAKHGAVWIKICATGGIFSPTGSAGALQYSEVELRAAVEEAARHGLRVAAHAHGTEGIVAALRAGVASIEHGSILSVEAIDLMKERGAWLVPQAYLFDGGIDTTTMPAPIRRKFNEIAPHARRSQEQAIRAGVKIAFGTDGPLPKNDPWQEFVALVQRGMTPIQAIQSATLRAAELLQLKDRGRLIPGLRADVVAVGGDPIRRIQAMRDIRFVMKAGKVYRRD